MFLSDQTGHPVAGGDAVSRVLYFSSHDSITPGLQYSTPQTNNISVIGLPEGTMG